MNRRPWAAAALALSVAACGGGGGDSASPSATPTPSPSPSPSPSLVLAGTAAQGAALSGARVEASCASGSGAATAAADGSFTITIGSGALPCVLRAPLADGSFVHSAIGGSGNGSFTVNVSPLTQLVVAQATGVSPDTLYAEFASRNAAVTGSALTDAVAALKLTLAGVVDLGSANPLSDAAAVGGTLDQKIDALVAALASSGTSLADMTATVAAASPVNTTPTGGTPPPATSGAASLPADLLLKPAAENCAALRSTTYRVVRFQTAAASSSQFTTVVIDAVALTSTNPSSSAPPQTFIPLGTCRYRQADGTEFVVSAAGVISFRDTAGGSSFRQGIAFPEQSHTVAEMAGSWIGLGWEVDNGSTNTYHGFRFSLTLDSAGKFTALSTCSDVKTCVPETATGLSFRSLNANATGGFDLVNTDPADSGTLRAFAYRAGGGELMVVLTASDGSVYLMTHERTNDLPTVGNVTRTFDLSVGNTLASTGPISESGNTILSVDAASSVYTRERFGYFSTAGGVVYATYNEQVNANRPGNGYSMRNPTTVPSSVPGLNVAIREFVALGMRGMGISAVELPPSTAGGTNGLFLINANQPGGAWLAPELIAKPYASNCSYFRTGTYRAVAITPVTAGNFPTTTYAVNASTLLVTHTDGSTDQLSATGNCRYTNVGGPTADIVVSPAGVAAYRNSDGLPVVAFAEQSHTVAELAGTWNKLGYSARGGGTYATDAATAVVNDSGAVTAITYCSAVNTTSCATVDAAAKGFQFVVNPAGGFDRTSLTDGTTRFFAYRAGNGDLMLVSADTDGSIGFWTQQRVNALPTVGAKSRNWDFSVSSTLVPSFSESTNIIASVDAATSTAVRTRIGGNGATWSETVKFNDPRDGYNFRPGGSTTDSLGAPVTINEFTSLALRGMGVSPLKLVNGTTGAESLLLSVSKP